MGRTTIFKSSLIIGALLATLAFNQCGGGGETSSSGGSKSGGLTKAACAGDLEKVFQGTYYPFLKSNCANCHAEAAGRAFANENLTSAFDQFKQIGYLRIGENAVNDNHNPPWTGQKHNAAIDGIQHQWETAITEFTKCTSQEFESSAVSYAVNYETSEMAIPAGVDINSPKPLMWTLTKANLKGPKVAALPENFSIKLEAEIGMHKDTVGNRNYFVTGLKMYEASEDTKIWQVGVKHNQVLLNWETTFMFVDAGVYRGQLKNNQYVSGGAMILPTTTKTGDKISFTFAELNPGSLPPPPPKPQLSFKVSDATLVTSPTDGLVTDVEVEFSLSFGVEGIVSVTLEQEMINETRTLAQINSLMNSFKDSGLKPKNARNKVNYANSGYLWDFQFIDGKTVSFKSLETTAKLRLRFSGNIRKEATNRILALYLKSPLLADEVKASRKYFVFEKIYNPDPPPPPAEVLSYSYLLSSNGVFGQYCVKCHNAVLKNGGYDITDYDVMIQKSVLVPGSLTSKIFRRMNDDPEFRNLQPMPLDGYRPFEERAVVKDWIEYGAFND